MEKSHGEILREEINRMRKPIAHVAKELGITRAWLYKLFEKEVFSPKDVETVSKIISFKIRVDYIGLHNPTHEESKTHDADFWKEQYHQLLIKYVALLEENNALMKRLNQQ